MLCRFKEDHPVLNIIVEYAREREHFPANNANNEEYTFLDKPRMISEDAPLQNVLEMDKRWDLIFSIEIHFKMAFS